MKSFLAAFFIALTASSHGASILIQLGSAPQAIKDSKGEFMLAPNVQFGFFKGISSTSSAQVLADLTTALSGSTAVDRTRIADYITNNFVPIGTGGTYGTSAYTYTDVTSGGKTVTGNVTSITFVNAGTGVLAGSVQSTGLVQGTKVFAILADSGAYASANEMGVISATTWNSPGGTSPSMNINLGTVDSQAEIFRGTVGSIVLGNFVPEPSVSALFLLGAAVGLRRRR